MIATNLLSTLTNSLQPSTGVKGKNWRKMVATNLLSTFMLMGAWRGIKMSQKRVQGTNTDFYQLPKY